MLWLGKGEKSGKTRGMATKRTLHTSTDASFQNCDKTRQISFRFEDVCFYALHVCAPARGGSACRMRRAVARRARSGVETDTLECASNGCGRARRSAMHISISDMPYAIQYAIDTYYCTAHKT